MTVRLGDGATESSPLARSTSKNIHSTAPVPPPKHDGEEVDPAAADMEKKAADMRDVLGEEPEGNLVEGVEDDVLWTLMRRFDSVRIRCVIMRFRRLTAANQPRSASCRQLATTRTRLADDKPSSRRIPLRHSQVQL